MSATTTLATCLNSLSLYPTATKLAKLPTLADKDEELEDVSSSVLSSAQSSSSPSSSSSLSTWPDDSSDKEALAEPTRRDVVLCDGPYVCVNIKTRPSQSHSDVQIRRRHLSPLSKSPPPRMMANPFKTIKSPGATSPSVGGEQQLCTHCKQGNFLEFCFANDRCRCSCHSNCPCKPCVDIRGQRQFINTPPMLVQTAATGKHIGRKSYFC